MALRELIESGRVTPVVDATLPLIQAPAGIGYVRDGQARGKVVITTGQPGTLAGEGPSTSPD
jgi:NADPH:quinone reductase-like Zn-dependent oxidoreductase